MSTKVEEDQLRVARAAARALHLTARVLPLGMEEAASIEGTAAARIELLVELTRAAWAVTGLPWPNVPRDQWPVRVRRLGDPS